MNIFKSFLNDTNGFLLTLLIGFTILSVCIFGYLYYMKTKNHLNENEFAQLLEDKNFSKVCLQSSYAVDYPEKGKAFVTIENEQIDISPFWKKRMGDDTFYVVIVFDKDGAVSKVYSTDSNTAQKYQENGEEKCLQPDLN